MSWDWLGRWNDVRRFGLLASKTPTRARTQRSIARVESLEQRLVLTPTSDEQLFVYLLNKARHDPQAYDDEANLGGILDGVEARQPLAVNADLFDSARFHAVEMADNNYFAHQSEVTGDWPNQMAEDQGYDLPDYFDLDNNYIESIAAGNAYGNAADVIKLLIVDDGVPSLGHRKHLLGIDSFNAKATEVGIGHGFNLSSLYDHYWAGHITHSDETDRFLTGVVYQDSNNNQQFSLNEGLAGVTVSINGQPLSTQTNAAGGWSIQVPGPGNYKVEVSGGAFVGTASSTVTVASLNREVDFISGTATGVVDFTAAAVPNAPPVNTVPGGPLNLQEDVAFSITGVSIADPDAGLSNVSVTLSVEHGTLQVPGGIANGVTGAQISGNGTSQIVLTAPLAKINATLASAQGLVYVGASNFAGADTLTVLTSDLGNTGTGGALTDSDTVGLVLAAVNDAPVNTVLGGPLLVVTETESVIGGLSLSDVDLGTESATFTLAVQHGTITVRTDVGSGLTPVDVAGNGTSTVVITAPLSRLLPTLQAASGVTYVSANGYVGPDTLTVTSNDLGNTGSGGAKTDVDLVAIQVVAEPIGPTLSVPVSPVSTAIEKQVVIGSGATVTDVDSANFVGGKITGQITGGAQSTDKLSVNKVGKKAGQLNVRKSDVRLGKTVIGQLSGGTNGSPLVIQFTSNVTLNDVQTVLQNVTLAASKKRLLAGTRAVQFVVTDPTNVASNSQSRDVTVNA